MVKTQNGYQAHSRLLRALAHPVRLQILDILSRQEACVCHLGTALNRPQPYVSQQLATLRDAGLVQDRREGTLIFYRVADDRFLEWLAASREMVEEAAGAAGGRSSRPPRFRRPRRSRRPIILSLAFLGPTFPNSTTC